MAQTASQTVPGQTVPGLTLEAVLNALPQSPDWKAADLTYQTSLRALESARAVAGLQVTGNSNYRYNATGDIPANPPQPAIPGRDGGNLSLGVTASVSILPWSQAALGVRRAELALVRAESLQRDTRATLRLNTTNQYFSVRQATADLALARRNQALAERQLEVARAQRQAGQVPQETLLNAQRAAENARVLTVQADGALGLARLTLFVTLGLAPNDAALSTTPAEPAAITAPLDELIKRALERRGEVLRATLGLQEAQEVFNFAQTDRLLPGANISASVGSVGTNGQAAGPTVTGGIDVKNGVTSLGLNWPVIQTPEPTQTTTGFSLSATLSIPILSPNQDANIQTAATNLENARLALETARRTVDLDVRGRYLDALNALARVGVAKSAVATAQQSLDTARSRRANGLNTPLDLETAEIAVQQAARDLEVAISTAQLASLRLKNATADLELPTGGA
jgi:outer membrane protein TolC